jgi:hypothetical protein
VVETSTVAAANMAINNMAEAMITAMLTNIATSKEFIM